MTNPWLSMWLSAANTWSGAARGFWAAEMQREMQRQQTAMLNQMTEQMIRFWTGGWMQPPSGFFKGHR